jgi:cysteinyl-tRNA synthetase
VLKSDGNLLGLLWNAPETWLRQTRPGITLTSSATGSSTMTREEIQHLVNERTLARHAKRFAASDDIRKKLSDAGVVLEDKPDGTTDWRTR